MTKLLDGIKVLDVSRAQAGPYVGALLADMGADVIKVEARTGEAARNFRWSPNSPSGYFESLNRGKRGIALDIKSTEGQQIVKDLAQKADIMLENFRAEYMDKLGLGYKVISKDNPGIIYLHTTGFGRTGPLKYRPCFDLVAQAMGGIMSVTGENQNYLPAGAAIGDQTAASNGLIGVLAALLHRERTGIGQEVDVSLFASQIALQTWEYTHTLLGGTPPKQSGRGHVYLGPLWRSFDTKDFAVCLAGITGSRWIRFCELLGLPHLQQKWDGADGGKLISALTPEDVKEIEGKFKERTTVEWEKILTENDMIFAPVYNYQDVLEHEQAKAIGIFVELKHPLVGKYVTVGNPISFSKTPSQPTRRAPMLGEHTQEILEEIGYSQEDISNLEEKEVIFNYHL